MKQLPKQQFTAQFKDQAVAMVDGGKSVAEVARALGLVEQTLRNWVKLAKQGKLHDGQKEVSVEQMELSRLRAENARLRLKLQRFTEAAPNVVRLRTVGPGSDSEKADDDE